MLSNLTVEYLRSLPNQGPVESNSLDYKIRFRDDKKDDIEGDTFRKDVTQFANTIGGDLVIGVDEDKGLPIAVPGVDCNNAMQLKERLDGFLRDVQPRIPFYTIDVLEIAPGKVVVVVRIARSWRAPHRIGADKGFYYRTNSSREPMNIEQVREAFVASAGLESKLRQFRESRVALLKSAPPFPLVKGMRVALHVMPLVGATAPAIVDPIGMRSILLENGVPGFRSGDGIPGVNFHGCYLSYPGMNNQHRAYSHWFRNGYREVVWVEEPRQRQDGDRDDPRVYDETTMGRYIAEALEEAVATLGKLQIPPPYFAAVSLIGTTSWRIASLNAQHRIVLVRPDGRATNETDLLPAEFVVEGDRPNIPALLRPVLDQVANAFGCQQSLNYNNGRWIHRNWFVK